MLERVTPTRVEIDGVDVTAHFSSVELDHEYPTDVSAVDLAGLRRVSVTVSLGRMSGKARNMLLRLLFGESWERRRRRLRRMRHQYRQRRRARW